MTARNVLTAILVLLLIPLVSAQVPDHVLSNSNNWQDVYSTTLYSNLMKVPSNFLTSSRHSTLILFAIPASRPYVQVITGRGTPYIVGYEDILKSRGYSEAEELSFDNVNLELARLLPDIHRFIVVDSAYGYNALSAAPYAAAAGYYVLFADEITVDEVTNFLEDRRVDDLILLGQLDRDVKDSMAQFDPEIVNEGDRFDNNIAMVKKYLNVNAKKQAILTNGEFIEAGMMTGADPVLFIGRTNVPDKTRDYIQNSDIDVGILIGNELIGAATFIRRQIGISVFVKFAQGSRAPSGPISQVEDLDRFPMPRFDLSLTIESIVYNRATGRLEVTYRNNVGIAAYVKSTITVNTESGFNQVLGDEDPIFIDGEETKTITYEIDLPEEKANATVFGVYGEAPESLENQLEGTIEIDFVEVSDESLIEIVSLYYDQNSGKFVITIKNIGDVKAYVDVEILDLLINGEEVTIGGDEILELAPGETGKIEVQVELADEDIEDNPIVKVKARYGERKLALIKETRAEFDFEEKKGDMVTYLLVLIVLILLWLIFFKKKKCPKCKRNTLVKKNSVERCTKCHYTKGGHPHKKH